MNILISGSSTGIGKAAALHLARQGHTVWAGVRSPKSFAELEKEGLANLRPVYLDVCDEPSVTEAVAKITAASGTLEGLVNNAGVAVGGPVEGVSLEDWQRQFDTNFFGQIRVTQHCLPLLRRSRGRIVNISSIAGKIASPYMGPYSASKHALEAMSDSLRRELSPRGVRVAIVEPGPIATPIWEKSQASAVKSADAYSATVREVYGASLEKFLKQVEKITRNAAPVEVVVRAIEHALTSSRPRTRYPVGRGISTAITLSRALPDRWMDRLIGARRN